MAQPPAGVTLSSEGTSDWAHWGLTSASSFDHKSGVTQQISNYTLLGSTNPRRFTDSDVACSWSGGTPTASAANSTTGIFFYGIGNGYRLRIPAQSSESVLKLYFGLWNAKGRFEARLSDGSVPSYVAYLDNPSDILDRVVTLSFSAASSGVNLIVEYTVENNYGNSWGNITLEAATLASTVVTPEAAVISQANWSVKSVDSEELVGKNGSAVNAIDGNPNTIWETNWYVLSPSPPHELQIDLGGLYRISGFRYLPRQDGSKDGWVTQYEVYVSTDGVNWGNPVATGTFAASATEKQIAFASVLGKFVRFRSMSNDAQGRPWASAAEIRVVGVPVKPSLRIVTPLDYHLQTGTDLLVRANAFLDNTAHSGWGVRFLLDVGPSNGGRSFDVYSPPFETTFMALSKTEHVVDAVLIDNTGREISSSDTRDQSLQVGIGNFYVAMGDSITASALTGKGDDFLPTTLRWMVETRVAAMSRSSTTC
jgi:hypothetical protein